MTCLTPNNVVDVSGLASDYVMLSLYPHMAHPSDKAARERYGATLLAQLYSGAGLELPNDVLNKVVEAIKSGPTDFNKAVHGGCMAGDVLLMRLEMIEAKVPDAGIDRAQHVASEHYKDRRDGTGKSFKAGRETVRNNWKKYANAAHLWAAYLILLRDAEANGVRSDPSTWLDGRKLAAIAVGLHTLAKSSPLHRKAAPVLPVAALEIIGIKSATLAAPALASDFRDALGSFEPRYQPLPEELPAPLN